ncbi:uncharacterized protein LOC130804616 [Amaranthus tricolor]|uniref:uncharacterized protein LOC130804616 n=1 Tax=Amaranthus tricolor TaxID=29722 RepID=UPI0025854F81|nr:uncharacterized protein LOC130804616 [Amaranthus tricolor]
MGSSFLKVIFIIFYITSQAHFISISTQVASEAVAGAPSTANEAIVPSPFRKLLSALCRHYDKSGKLHAYPCGQASTATYKEVSKGASGGKASGKEALAGPLRKDVSGSREAGRLWGKSTSGHHQISKLSEEPKITSSLISTNAAPNNFKPISDFTLTHA